MWALPLIFVTEGWGATPAFVEGVTVTDEHIEALCTNNAANVMGGGRFKTLLPEGESPFVFLPPAAGVTPTVFLSAPHVHQAMRYNVDNPTPGDGIHLPERNIGGILEMVSELTGMPGIWNKWLADDANVFDVIDPKTAMPGWIPGAEHPFKAKMREFVEANPSVKIVLDIHGSSAFGSDDDTWAVDLGSGGTADSPNGRDSLVGPDGKGEDAFTLLKGSIDAQGILASDNEVYRGCCNAQLTVTNYASQTLGLDGIQLETAPNYRDCGELASDAVAKARLKAYIQGIVNAVASMQVLYSEEEESDPCAEANCPSGMPNCGQGVEAVDVSGEDDCCPSWSCPDPCAEASCPDGMPNCGQGVDAVDVSSEEDCCPSWTCPGIVDVTETPTTEKPSLGSGGPGGEANSSGKSSSPTLPIVLGVAGVLVLGGGVGLFCWKRKRHSEADLLAEFGV